MRATLPGLLFAIALALAAKGLSYASGGQVSAILLAVVAGILWRNLAGVGAWAESGITFASRNLLRIGIALIGLRLTFALLSDVSLEALQVVIACVVTAIVAALALGRLFGIAPGLRPLLAVGTAICGCTAIIAVAPVLKSRQQDIGIAIACIVLFGSIALVGYPWLAPIFLGDDPAAAGVFFGAAIQDTSQVVGASLIYAEQFDADDTVAIAGFTKFIRTFGLLLLIPAIAFWVARTEVKADPAGAKGLLKSALPLFVVAFIVLVGVRTAGDAWWDGAAWRDLLAAAQLASEMLLLCGMAAVGLGITFSHLREAGWRPLAVAFLAAAATGSVALALL